MDENDEGDEEDEDDDDDEDMEDDDDEEQERAFTRGKTSFSDDDDDEENEDVETAADRVGFILGVVTFLSSLEPCWKTWKKRICGRRNQENVKPLNRKSSRSVVSFILSYLLIFFTFVTFSLHSHDPVVAIIVDIVCGIKFSFKESLSKTPFVQRDSSRLSDPVHPLFSSGTAFAASATLAFMTRETGFPLPVPKAA